ncbi:hypothetical protein L1887_28572 [Cichorium endivia]|nr:hypothetical protein L1887_28572 [Cichorium endivia]
MLLLLRIPSHVPELSTDFVSPNSRQVLVYLKEFWCKIWILKALRVWLVSHGSGRIAIGWKMVLEDLI